MHSSIEMIRRIKPDIYCKERDSYSAGAEEFLADFRKKYKAVEIIERLEGLKKLKVLVIGDTIIDQYHYCSSIGKSPKDNVMVVRYLAEEKFAGGVLAVANHVAGFCDDVTLVTCLGRQNTHEGYVRAHLGHNIKPQFFYRDDTATIVKLRYVEPTRLTKMFGVSYLEDYPLPESVSNKVCKHLETDVNKYDLVLVVDYGHGFIDVDITMILKFFPKFLAVNTQTNTDNAGFNLITQYEKVADYICVDEPEARLACQDRYGSLEDIAKSLGDKVAITHGQYDTLMYDGNYYKIPIFSKEVKDTTGAGDAFLSITAPCVVAGFPMDMVGFIGNAAGALKVRTVCNRSAIDPKELYRFIGALLK